MNITIENFKTIKKLVDFELKPLTVLSGVNSSGKSSFIQLLLLLKQTVEIDSSKEQLFLTGNYYQVKEYKDIVYNKEFKNKLKVGFSFDKSEFLKVSADKRISLFDSYDDYRILVELEYDVSQNSEYISDFIIKFILPEGDKKEQYISFVTHKDPNVSFDIDTNTGIFSNELYFSKPQISDIEYSSIFPANFEIHKPDEAIFERLVPNIEGFKDLLTSYFSEINYIGPLRDQPKDDYELSRSHMSVGAKGEFVAQVLENFSVKPIIYNQIITLQEQIRYKEVNGTLLEGIKYWMCDYFKVASDIRAEKENDSYKIYLTTPTGLVNTVKHVGFGISQILPVVVQGLLAGKGTFILEQPEIHLHPKLQSKLFDFLYGLTLLGKYIIIETHSDHFITRMRRRIAEDLDNKLKSEINLTFIEQKDGQNIFRSLDLDDYGGYSYFPDDFIEQSNIELKAIVKAQMRKRISNR